MNNQGTNKFRNNHTGILRRLVPIIINELRCTGPAVTQVDRLLDIVDTRGWDEAITIFVNLRRAVIAFATGHPLSKEEAKSLGINLTKDGVPRI